ncbi:MAG: radical SAM protein [Methylophilaceae bacterium 17-44-8]|nr:MAG: radical SAM protein [Methylophilaceae bacterium 17-44-8]
MTHTQTLTVIDHNRVFHGFTYVYPVVSRRAGGVSIGINLNPNNACNWQCVYCQVPNLTRGMAPTLDAALLEHELDRFLAEIQQGDFMQTYVEHDMRVIKDIAFSGNGEPTSSKQFDIALVIVEKLRLRYQLDHAVKTRLITNGSLMHRPSVMNNISQLKQLNGEVWFKLDAGTRADIQRINQVYVNPQQHLARLKTCASLCPTYIQTCMFGWLGNAPTEDYLKAYLNCVAQVRNEIKGVYLYGVARPSYQPEATSITRLSLEQLETIAERIRALGVTVSVSE